MNYVEKLTDEELTYICNIITGKKIKKYFQNNPQKFSKIRPGFRPNGLSEKMAVELTVRYRKEPFILSFVNDKIVLLLKEIDIQRNNFVKEGKNSESALLLTLPQSVFSENLDVYFKIAGQSHSQEYIQLVKSAMQLLLAKQESALSDVAETEKNVDIDTLNEQLSDMKAEWEDSEKDYIQDIEKLKADVEETKQKLIDKEKKLEKANAKIKELETELEEVNKLEEKSVSSGKMVRDAEYQFTSLCKVIYDYDGRSKLVRLSDIENGIILGDYLPGAPIYSKLYTKEVPGSEGFVGIWDWRVSPNFSDPTRDYILSVYKENYIPVEVIIVPDCTSISELLEKLQQGIIGTAVSRRVIFSYWNESDIYEGVFCTLKNLDVIGNRVRLKSNIFSLPVFLLTEEDMFFVDNKRYFHRKINIGRPSKIIHVKNPLEIVKDILVQRTTWSIMKQRGFVKTEYQKINSFLRELPTDELYEKIMAACECGMAEAKEFVERFIEAADKYLNNSDLDSEVLSCCIKNHPALMEICEGIIEDKWREENALRIAEENEAFNLTQRKIAEQSQLLEQIVSEYTETKKKLDDALREYERQEQLADEVEKKISERIEKATSHAAEFVAEMAFRFPMNTGMLIPPQEETSMAAFIEGEHLPVEDLELNKDWSELNETIRLELFEAGVSEKYAEGLGAYMYAAYVNHVPLLLAGPCAHDIADAFSSALCGRRAAVLRLEGNYCKSIVEQCLESDEKVVVIKNLFSSSWNPYLPEIITDKDKFYMGIHAYSEDLVIEPNSFFNYMIPLLTEHFVDKLPTGKFAGGYLDENFQHYVSADSKPYYNKLFNDMGVGILCKNLFQQMLTDMHRMLQTDSDDYDYIFTLLPYAYVCDRTDILRTYLFKSTTNKSSISTETYSYISTYLGEEE